MLYNATFKSNSFINYLGIEEVLTRSGKGLKRVGADINDMMVNEMTKGMACPHLIDETIYIGIYIYVFICIYILGKYMN